MKKYLFGIGILLLSLFVLPHSVLAAIARDNVTNSLTTCSSGTSCSISFATSGSNRFISVYVMDGSNLVTGVTYASTTMSLIQDVATGNGSEHLRAYGLIAPAVGANNVVVTSSASNVVIMGAVSYTGADQSSQPDNSTNGSFSSASSPFTTTLTTLANNSWATLFGRTLTVATFAGTGSTFIGSDSGSDGRNVIMYDSNASITPAGSTSMGITWSGTNSGVTIMFSVAPFVPPSVTGSGTINMLAKFTGASTVGDALFSDDGSNTTLTAGNLFMPVSSMMDSVTSGALNFGTTNATTMTFGRAGQNMVIDSKLGIGTSTPIATLHVVGDIRANFLNLLAGGAGLDTYSSGLLSIGSSTASSINLGRTGVTVTSPGPVKVGSYGTVSNCSSSATPAVCGSAPAGSVAMPTGGSTLVVNTSAVTANSQIFITEDSSLGTKLGITCNTTTGRVYSVNARTASTSFTIKSSANPATNKACLSYFIVN